MKKENEADAKDQKFELESQEGNREAAYVRGVKLGSKQREQCLVGYHGGQVLAFGFP